MLWICGYCFYYKTDFFALSYNSVNLYVSYLQISNLIIVELTSTNFFKSRPISVYFQNSLAQTLAEKLDDILLILGRSLIIVLFFYSDLI